MATETTMLPKLNNHWRPSDSHVMASMDAMRVKKNGRLFHGTKQPARKGVPSSSKVTRQQDSNNKLVERQKPIVFPLSSRSSPTKKDQNNNNNNNISIRRLIAINGNIQDRKTTTRDSHCDGKTPTQQQQQQDLGVNGVSLKTPKKSNDKNNNSINIKRNASANDLISPLLKAFQDENNTGDPSHHHYQRLLNRNSFLSGHQQQTSSSSKPKLVTRISLDETKSSIFSKHEDKNSSVTKYATTIAEYLRRENARYAQNEFTVKKILFDNWLHNIRIEEFEGDTSSIAISIPTSLPADPEDLLMMDDEV